MAPELVLQEILPLHLFKVQGLEDGVFKLCFKNSYYFFSPLLLTVHANFEMVALLQLCKCTWCLPCCPGLSEWLQLGGFTSLFGF
jgi:hypothetical protein